MKMYRAYKTEFNLNNKQRSLMEQCAGLARFTYNWALDKRIKEYESTKKFLTAYDLQKKLNSLKKTEFQWMYDYSKSIPQSETVNVERAFQNFFRRVKQKKGKVGFPKFKSKHKDLQSFRVEGIIHVESNKIKLPRIGWLKLHESNYLPTKNVKILSATVSKKAGRWFVSVQVEIEKPETVNKNTEIIGIDLGIKTLAVTSDGTTYENPKALKSNLVKLKKIQRKYSRQCRINPKGSSNQNKTKKKLQLLHFRISNIRKDSLHKITSDIVKTKQAKLIVIEDLNVSGMMKNRKLSRAISDCGLFEFRRQLEYKCSWENIQLITADRFFPSSKTCSCCGQVKDELPLSERTYHCDCGLVIDRDLNAAINLRNYHAGSSSVKVCGEDVSLSDKQFSKKQKENRKSKKLYAI